MKKNIYAYKKVENVIVKGKNSQVLDGNLVYDINQCFYSIFLVRGKIAKINYFKKCAAAQYWQQQE